jgi:dTDP-4-dehydrorhamnose reductase
VKILVLGATGMLGHKAMQVLSHRHDVAGTVRRGTEGYRDHPVLKDLEIVGDVDVNDLSTVEKAVETVGPDVVINCIGIVKQLKEAHDPVPSIAVNALFPHLLAQVCVRKGIRMVHMSTDCVFSGKKGLYLEDDFADADDLYGRTKYLGEVDYPGCLTIRTSIIGRELDSNHGLLEWFFGQRGKQVSGYTKAIFSGLTTNALSDVIGSVIERYPDLRGVWQVASAPINKYDLLVQVRDQFGLEIGIKPDASVAIDRSLDPSRFIARTGIAIPTWPAMIEQLYLDPTPYDQGRSNHAYQ